jgi:small subunit ribosomal protein S20
VTLRSELSSSGSTDTRFFVANIKSQIKRNRQNEKRRLRNRAVRSELRTREKAAVAAAGGDGEAEALRQTIKRIDKAAAKGVIHKNTAARKKSRLVAKIRSLSEEE